jgi:hypothetical protein
MVDQVQKMIENMSDLRVKELPALADGVRSQYGTEQAATFSADVGSSLDTLITTLTGAKEELTGAVGSLTGEEMSVPGEDSLDAELDSMGGDDLGLDEPTDLDAELDGSIDEPEDPELANLGRERI